MRQQEKDATNYHINMRWITFIPLMILVGIVPLIVRLTEVRIVDEAAIKILNSKVMVEVFSQFKASFVIFLVGIMLIVAFFIFDKKMWKSDKYLNIIYGGLGIYSLFTILSVFTSPYKHTAVWGMYDRAEGGIVLIGYVVIMLYTLYIVKNTQSYQYIIWPLFVMLAIMCFLGYFQYTGEDLLIGTDWGKSLIVPEKYKVYRNELTLLYEEKRVYGTLFHYNYVGSFAAMMIPLFGILAIFIKDYKKQILFAVGCIGSIALLLGSSSRAGLIGIGCSILVFIILFARFLIKRWKVLAVVVAVAVILLIGLNQVTKGAIFERIPSLINDAAQLFLPQEGDLDYKEQLLIQDITHEEDRAVIWTKGHQLKVGATKEGLEFKDENEVTVPYEFIDQQYVTTDERYKDLKIEQTNRGNNFGVFWRISMPDGKFLFDGNTFNGVHLVDPITLERIDLEHPEVIGFKGKERIGSARGYIWSRSLPLLKETLLVGKGPDSYLFEFPQNDLLGKAYAYGTTNMLVDKPHNLYLQIGINQGVVALVAFIILVGAYFVQSIKLYACKRSYTESQIIGMACMVAIVGYMGAGIFNDSVVSVAPIFWTLLGLGLAINYINSKLSRENERAMPHATIDMKKRKYIDQE